MRKQGRKVRKCKKGKRQIEEKMKKGQLDYKGGNKEERKQDKKERRNKRKKN